MEKFDKGAIVKMISGLAITVVAGALDSYIEEQKINKAVDKRISELAIEDKTKEEA